MEHGTARLDEHRSATGAEARPTPNPAAQLRVPPAPPLPDEPLAVVVAGADGSGRSAVLASLVTFSGPLEPKPPAGYLALRFGATPWVEPAEVFDLGGAVRLARRRDVGLADPLLRHFTLVEAPATERLGYAGTQLLLDVARRGGAVVYAVAAARPLAGAELAVLAALAESEVRVVFALTPDRSGHWALPGDRLRRSRRPADRPRAGGRPPRSAPRVPNRREVESPHSDGVTAALAVHAAAVAARVPALADAAWHAVDPAAADVAFLRRDLIGWSVTESLRRASENPPYLPGAHDPVVTSPHLVASGWQALLGRRCRAGTQAVRRHVGIELAQLHLRCVQHVLGVGLDGFGRMLDDELRALALQVVTETDRAVDRVLDEVFEVVLEGPERDGMWQRVVHGLRAELAPNDLAKALLIGADGAIATVPGEPAVLALHCYQPPVAPTVLPGVAVALTDDCWTRWEQGADGDVAGARSWVQSVVRALQLDLCDEIDRRFRAVQGAVERLIKVDPGNT